MNFQNLLNQVLGGVQQSGGDKSLIDKLGGGAAVAGLAAMLLSKKTRSRLLTTGSARRKKPVNASDSSHNPITSRRGGS